MEVIAGISLLLLPLIVFLPIIGIAVFRKWWSHNTLSIIFGIGMFIVSLYYMFHFGIQKFWPMYIVALIVSVILWDYMRIIFHNMEYKEIEKTKRDNN